MMDCKEQKHEGSDSCVFYVTLPIPEFGLEDANRRIANLRAEVRRQVIAVRSKCAYCRIVSFTLSFIVLYSIFCIVKDL